MARARQGRRKSPLAGNDARSLALRVLSRIRRQHAYSNLVLSAVLDRTKPSQADRALTTELVYGVLRHRRQLDWVIDRFTRRPISGGDPEIADVLRIATYQQIWLDRIPAHAAVNAAVNHAREIGDSKTAGFVNAVLRKMSSQTEIVVDFSDESLGLFSSLPDDLAYEFEKRLGPEEARLCGAGFLERAPLCIRANTIKASREETIDTLVQEGAEIRRGVLGSDALYVRGLASPFVTDSYCSGLWTVQDEAAQLVCALLGGRESVRTGRILDACAGVGGKSAHLAALYPDASIVSIDRSMRKLDLLVDHGRRLGFSPEVVRGDVIQPCFAEGTFDAVLLDAPCSGIGVLRRHPELRWRFDRKRVDELQLLQRNMIRAVIPLLKPGGVLVYSVCTVTSDEGPDQVDWIRTTIPELVPTPPEEERLRELAPNGILELWPHRHRTDGFFAARLQRVACKSTDADCQKTRDVRN